jgi:glycosyltransferase involved in cell wall biosynthesis
MSDTALPDRFLRSEAGVESTALYIVVVLYNRSIDDSPTCADLLKQDCPGQRNIFLVYDNSACSKIGSVPEGWNVHLDPSNGGLSRAYNFAVAQAKALSCKWILLLDQDSNLPRNFLAGIHDSLLGMQAHPEVVAIIPIVKAGDRQVSPMYPRPGRESSFNRRNVVTSEWLTAINSGTCVRNDFIDEIGGFCDDFWLDYLDYWLFKMINNARKSVYVGDIVLEHDLSVANMNGVSVARYKSVLAAELRFTNGYLPLFWRMIIVPRLLARAIKHLLLTRDKRIAASMAMAAVAQVGYLCRFRRSSHEKHSNG